MPYDTDIIAHYPLSVAAQSERKVAGSTGLEALFEALTCGAHDGQGWASEGDQGNITGLNREIEHGSDRPLGHTEGLEPTVDCPRGVDVDFERGV